MNPLILTAIHAAQRAFEEIKHHEHEQPGASLTFPQQHSEKYHHPSLLAKLVRRILGKKER